jgi:capsular polysaccharide biosynthesis protein
MRARELTGHKWISRITITNPNYTGRIKVSVYAHNQAEARQLLKAQYQIQDHHIGAIRKVQ